MSAPILVILVLTSDTSSPDAALTAGVREALGSAAEVVIEPGPATSLVEARTIAERRHASAVAEVRWSGSHARLHVFSPLEQAFHDEEIAFAPTDAPAERERAVGLVVGAMVREVTASEPAVDTPPPAAPKPAEPPPTPTPKPVTEGAGRSAIVSAEAAASGALGVGGDGAELGPSLGVGIELSRWVSLRGVGVVRFGSLEAAAATTTTTFIGAGVAFRVIGHGATDRLLVDVLLQGGAVEHAVRRSAPSETHGRWLGGAMLGPRFVLRVASAFEPFAGVSAQTTSGDTPVAVGRRTVATIPALFACVEAGVRVRF